MNVLVCIPCLMTGGTEIQTLNLVKALITAEHKVTTVCYFEHSTNMVERYKQAGSNVCLLSPDGKRPVGITNTVILLYKGFDPSRSGGKVLCGGETGICVPCRSQSGRYRSQPVGIGGFYV